MQYRVHLRDARTPDFMVSYDGLVVEVTYRLRWALGHTVEDVVYRLKRMDATWRVTPLNRCPRGLESFHYEGGFPDCTVVPFNNEE